MTKSKLSITNPLSPMEDFNKLVVEFKKGDTIFFQVIGKNRSFYAAFII